MTRRIAALALAALALLGVSGAVSADTTPDLGARVDTPHKPA